MRGRQFRRNKRKLEELPAISKAGLEIKVKNIVLIGFMGTGKSTVGRILAGKLNRRFIDTDKEIEKLTGITVARLITNYGIIRFRSEETLLIKKLTQEENQVIATGGGTLLNPENDRLLRQNGIIICLTASPEVIHNRVKRKKKERPLLAKGDLMEQIKILTEERREIYQKADFTADTGNGSLEATVKSIIDFIKR